MEELGELCHAHLKQEQGIRGTAAQHEAKAKDAIGDILIYLADYTAGRGWDLQAIVEDTWAEVSRRDWRANPADGKAGVSGSAAPAAQGDGGPPCPS